MEQVCASVYCVCSLCVVCASVYCVCVRVCFVCVYYVAVQNVKLQVGKAPAPASKLASCLASTRV